MTTCAAAVLPKVFAPAAAPAAAGPGAVVSSLQSTLRTSSAVRCAHVLLDVNQQDGFVVLLDPFLDPRFTCALAGEPR